MKAGGMVFVSGRCAVDSEGKIVGVGDIAVQTERAIQNMQLVLEAAGGGLEDVTMVHIFLTDYANYDAMNKVYDKHFGKTRPARYCVKCELVDPEFLIELAGVAVLGG
jgi:aminoacrylate peracid reductase